jgi:glutamate racemase
LSDAPIGVFDSGVGGLSVLKCVRALLPQENLIYVADSGFAPYGKRPLHEIQQRCIAISEFLISQGAKAIVVACNTATAAAIELLREQFTVPIIGMEPGLKPALSNTKSKVVAVLATDNTLTSNRFDALIKRYNTDAQVIIQPCTELVELIENGELNSAKMENTLEKIIPRLVAQNTDTIVLGCTHYPLIADQIARLCKGSAIIIDTGAAVAKEVARRIAAADSMNTNQATGTTRFWSSAVSPHALSLFKSLWPEIEGIESLQLVEVSV